MVPKWFTYVSEKARRGKNQNIYISKGMKTEEYEKYLRHRGKITRILSQSQRAQVQNSSSKMCAVLRDKRR